MVISVVSLGVLDFGRSILDDDRWPKRGKSPKAWIPVPVRPVAVVPISVMPVIIDTVIATIPMMRFRALSQRQ
jgi:hypothetical protein